MRVALYARVSLEEGNKDDRRYQEPENQLVPLRTWAASQGWEIVGEYVDRGSGADPNRPEFKRLLNDGMMLKFANVLVWRWDRFSREPMWVAVGRVQRLRERGVGIKSLQESWLDTGKENPMGDLIHSILAWAAAEERRKISDRTKAGIARRRAIGQWRGGRPRTIPLPSVVCEKAADGSWKCRQCEKHFRDDEVFLRKWNAHRRRHEWMDALGVREKGPPQVDGDDL